MGANTCLTIVNAGERSKGCIAQPARGTPHFRNYFA